MGRVKPVVLNLIKTLILPIGILLLFMILARIIGKSGFGSWASIRMIAQQTMIGACIALAMTCNLINNRWDFSVGLIVVLSVIISAPIAESLHIGAPGLLMITIIAAVILSLINAVVYLLIRVPTLVVSIGTMIAYESVALVWRGGSGAKISDTAMLIFGRSPWIFALGILAGLVFYMLFSKTRFGYNVRALAGNQALAVSTGIKEKRNLLSCYILSGILLGCAATMNLSVSGIVQAPIKFNGAMGMMFEAFPAVFIGLYLSRYTNLAFGTFVGTFTIKLLMAGMLSLGIPASMQTFGIGIFLVVFLAVTSNQAKIGEYRRKRTRLHKLSGA
ncbi:MAG: hypothetical protein GXY05_02055 [Clostridiales bacterium]|nr:hypothetical protein [Clostridiales bacterium]